MISLICVSGPAESGKSTLIKQIKIIHSHGFSNQELISFKVLDSCKANTAFVFSPFRIQAVRVQQQHCLPVKRLSIDCSLHSLRYWTTCWPLWSLFFGGWECWGLTSLIRTTRWHDYSGSSFFKKKIKSAFISFIFVAHFSLQPLFSTLDVSLYLQ